MEKKKGQALMETALVIPLLLILICGIVDFGRILRTQSNLNLITQESVRLAGLGKGYAQVRQFAYDKVDSASKSTLLVDFNPINESQRRSGDYVTVKLSCDVKYITPFMNIIFPTPFKARTQSTIRVE